MTQPKNFQDSENTKKLCKLQKTIHGLKQASRSLNFHFD